MKFNVDYKIEKEKKNNKHMMRCNNTQLFKNYV